MPTDEKMFNERLPVLAIVLPYDAARARATLKEIEGSGKDEA
jgi:hypothetical protein